MPEGACLNSRTLVRRTLVRLAPSRPPAWLSARMLWRLYGFLEWAAWRVQDAALVLEDEERKG